MSITIKDIAKVTGVSVSTVSKALSGNYSDISDEARTRIRKIAAQLHYSPNRAAAAIVNRQTGNIAFVTQNIKNPFFSEVLEGIEKTANKAGFVVFVCNTDDDVEKENQFMQNSLVGLVDGAIVVPTEDRETAYHPTRELGFPVVVYGSTTYKNAPYACVHSDNKLGGYLAVKHLIQNGHRDILFIGGSKKNAIYADRLIGYRQALEHYNIPFREEYVFQYRMQTVWGSKAVHLAIGQALPFTAIFCANDFLVFGAMHALDELGLSIPGDISIVGFDDVRDISESLGLTCMCQPKVEMGMRAAQMLISLIQKKEKSESVSFQPALVERKSVRNIKE